MAIITTPAQAIEVDDLSLTQRETIKNSLGLADFPYQPDKTYIVFDSAVGSNDLHIITGASNSYSINKGDGTQPVDYTDTGGTKALTYAVAGRYMITIDGTFNGIDTIGASAANKNKYIEIIAGSNYPTTIPVSSFKSCTNLINAKFEKVTSIGNNAFDGCISLKYFNFNSVITIGDESFNECSNIEVAYFPTLTTIGDFAFFNCVKMSAIYMQALTTIGSSVFDNCDSLVIVKAPSLLSESVINVDGDVIPKVDVTSNLGSSSLKFLTVFSQYLNNGNNTFGFEIVEIGDWNMDVTDALTVSYPTGVTFSKMVFAHAVIINDAGTVKIPLRTGTGLYAAPSGFEQIQSDGVRLFRTIAKEFDSTDFDSTSFNRGFVVMIYINV